ncbi:MAG TPA: hypothetical protein VJX23_11015 [Candidatus Binataceae bacterium]|nr:hypothetical protein [Candidatus Binataceae bacterium]
MDEKTKALAKTKLQELTGIISEISDAVDANTVAKFADAERADLVGSMTEALAVLMGARDFLRRIEAEHCS